MTDTTTASGVVSMPFGRQLGETARATRALLVDVLAEAATSFETWVVLNLLATHGPDMRRNLLQRELADGLEADATVIARLFAELAGKGLIQDYSPRGDAGDSRIALTEQGNALYGRLSELVTRTTDQVVGGIDPDDLRITRRVLAGVKERANALRSG